MVAGLALNLFFVSPYGTLAIADPWDAAVIVVFLLTGVAVATLVDRAAHDRAGAADPAGADTLVAPSRGLIQAGNSPVTLLPEICHTLDLKAVGLSRTDTDGSRHLEARHGVLDDDHSCTRIAWRPVSTWCCRSVARIVWTRTEPSTAWSPRFWFTGLFSASNDQCRGRHCAVGRSSVADFALEAGADGFA